MGEKDKVMKLRKDILAGVAGGLAGGTVMTVVMLMGKKTGMIPDPLPIKIEREIEERRGLEEKTSPQQEKILAFAGHYLVSALFGAGYGLLHWATNISPILAGPLYGLGVYTLNLVGVGPAAQLTPGPWREEPLTVGRRMMMHAVFGTVTAFVSSKVSQKNPS
jgi:hypothetical protein